MAMTRLPTLGDSELDEDHDTMLDLIAQLARADASQAPARLVQLYAHVAEHFEREDADLRGWAGGNAACHIDEHGAVLKSLVEVRTMLESGTASPDTADRVVFGLCQELQRWFPVHVAEMDAALAAHRSRQRFGGAPIRFHAGGHALPSAAA